MSNNIDLSTRRTLDLLRQLQDTAAATAQAEESLNADLRTRRFQVERKYQQAVKSLEERQAVATAEINTLTDGLNAQVEATHKNRLARIKRFQNSGVRNMSAMSQQARERFLGKVQVKRVALERKRNDALKEVKAVFEAKTADLEDRAGKLATLERAARGFFSGFGSFVALLRQKAEPCLLTDHVAVMEHLDKLLPQARDELASFRKRFIPQFFTVMSLPMAMLLALVVGGAVLFGMGADESAVLKAGVVVGVWLVVVIVLHAVGRAQSSGQAKGIARLLTEARAAHAQGFALAEAERDARTQATKDEFDASTEKVKKQWGNVDDVQANFEEAVKTKLANTAPMLLDKNDALLASKMRFIASQREERLREIDTQAALEREQHGKAHRDAMAELAAEEESKLSVMEAAWQHKVQGIDAELRALAASAEANVAAWSKALVDAWQPPVAFSPATRFGSLMLEVPSDARPKHERLALPGPATITQPLMLAYPQQGSILIETRSVSDGESSAAINNVLLRLLCATPPGKVSFTIIDPVGLGQNFAGVMHLGDYEETLINRRIWTQRDQIEERLAELNDHIEKVIQMYLRNEYETITQYNEQAGSVAEKYHFLVVADFPANFSDVAAKRLQSIAVSGPRCGVFTLIHWDKRQPMPDGFVPDELRQNSVCLRAEGGRYIVEGSPDNAVLTLDAAPSDELAVPLLHKVGKASIDSNVVQVPFSQIAPKPDALWQEDTTHELRVPVGRTGATKLQYLAIGKGTRQHALFAGKTGSGKSTLFHVIITNLALYCDPDQVEFYLIDFKKGVEFKCYANAKLPHARVIAIESDREFGLSVLQRVDEELKRRGDMFRKLGVQDIAGYKKAGGKEPVPRSLLIIDEFQEFFVEDDTISQTASVLFDRIVRQGRAFGIHVLLGSQTLGGAFTLARATMGQMVIRVALQCNEADAYLIMDENNAAPRLLTRPGEGIYNDAAGAIEGNSPFQVCWLGDDERDAWLHKVHDLAAAHPSKRGGPIVFEGNAPAEVRENELLATALRTKPTTAPAAGRIWLGAPNSIKGPTEAVFHRQSGSHLLVVGQREEITLSMLGVSLVSLAAQYPAGCAKFTFIHNTPSDTPDARLLEKFFKVVSHGLQVVQGHELADAMTELAEDLKARTAGESKGAPPVFVFVHGLHKFKKLKADDDLDFSFSSSDAGPSPASQFTTLVTEGSTQGMHVIATFDTYNNVTRFLSRKLLTEFEMRLVFQMSANDSASLIDSPKAANLGMHRAILHNEQAGTDETFRPYAEPDSAWFESVSQ